MRRKQQAGPAAPPQPSHLINPPINVKTSHLYALFIIHAAQAHTTEGAGKLRFCVSGAQHDSVSLLVRQLAAKLDCYCFKYWKKYRKYTYKVPNIKVNIMQISE